jgi:hypothetical protein
LQLLLLLEFENEVSLRFLSASTFYSTSRVASSVINVAKSPAAKLLLLARSASRLTSPSNVTTTSSSAATRSAIISILTLSSCISIMPLVV